MALKEAVATQVTKLCTVAPFYLSILLKIDPRICWKTSVFLALASQALYNTNMFYLTDHYILGSVLEALFIRASFTLLHTSQGPCSLAIDASHSSFHLYSHGIYRKILCVLFNEMILIIV